MSPFRVEVPAADLGELADRLRRTRWPERETVPDWSQGVPLDHLRDVCATALEQPELLVADLRAFFRLVR